MADPFLEGADFRLEGFVGFRALRERSVSDTRNGGFGVFIDLRILPICPSFSNFYGAVEDREEAVKLLSCHTVLRVPCPRKDREKVDFSGSGGFNSVGLGMG